MPVERRRTSLEPQSLSPLRLPEDGGPGEGWAWYDHSYIDDSAWPIGLKDASGVGQPPRAQSACAGAERGDARGPDQAGFC